MSQQKIANTILSLHPKKAAEVLQQMNESTVLAVGDAVLRHAHDAVMPSSSLQSSADNKAARTLRAFTKETKKAERGSALQIVRSLYTVAFGSRRSAELIKLLLSRQVNQQLDFIHVYSEDEILNVIKDESSVVIAIVLGAMHPHRAGKLLALLPADTRTAAVRQIAKQSTPDIESIEIIERTLKRKLHELTAGNQQDAPGGVSGLSSILMKLPDEAQNTLLENMEDAELASQLREKLFSWDYCFAVPKEELREILGEFSMRDLAQICAAYGEPARKGIARGLSARNQILLDDEIERCKSDSAGAVNAEELKAVFSKALRAAAARHPRAVQTI